MNLSLITTSSIKKMNFRSNFKVNEIIFVNTENWAFKLWLRIGGFIEWNDSE